jgi:hypothetical protein
MQEIIGFSLIFATASMAAGFTLSWMRRKVAKKRVDHRMGQALRRGLANPDGIRSRPSQVVQWQACESTSRLS